MKTTTIVTGVSYEGKSEMRKETKYRLHIDDKTGAVTAIKEVA